MSNNSDFSIINKCQIYMQQYNNNFYNLLKLPILNCNNHLYHLSLVPKINNLIICPYCINCYIHPGKNIVNELKNTYKHHIVEYPSLFNSEYIRPGECDYIIHSSNGGSNDVNNGIFICSQCYKQKANLTTDNFFLNFFSFYNGRFFKNSKTITNTIEMMDIDENNNKCAFCKSHSIYKICQFCAGKKNIIIKLAS